MKLLTLIRILILICQPGIPLFSLHAALPGAADHSKPDFRSLGRPAFRVYTDKDGLPQNVVECLAFDRKGYLWAGTQNGAAYYNGRKWTVVNMPGRTVSNYVFAILAASDGSLWFGTQLAGLARLKDGKWETFTQANSGLPGDEVRCLLEIPGPGGSSALWVGTGSGGLARFEAGKWTSYGTANSPLPNNNVRGLALTRNAAGAPSLWVGTLGGGLARYENERWTVLDASNSGLPTNQVRCLAADPAPAQSPSLWIGTSGGGLVRYEAGRWTTFNTANSGVPGDAIRSLGETATRSGRRTLWVGTNGNGLARLESGRWTTFDSGNSQIPNNSVLALLSDSSLPGDEGLWVGTLDGGLAHYVPNGWNALDAKNSGLPDSQVWSLLETTSPAGDSVYWFGTSGGLARLEAGQWSSFTSKNSGLPAYAVLNLLEAGAGPQGRALWAGTNGGGLARLESGKWTTFNSKNSALADNVILSLCEAKIDAGPRQIWAGTERGGLARFDGSRWTVFNKGNSGLPDNRVLSLLETRSTSGRSALWVGTNGGLARLESGRWTVFTTANSALPNNQVWGLGETVSESGRRHLWVGTAGGGVARMDPSDAQAPWLVLSEGTTPALPDDTIWQIRQDGKRRIYFFTDKGIAQLTPRAPTAEDRSEYSLLSFNTSDGLPSNGCNQGASMTDRAGRLWVGTGAGAAFFDPAAQFPDSARRPLYIERILLGGKESPIPDRASLAYNQNNFQFEYALLSYFREADTQYRFQLAGFDKSPSGWTADSRKEYTNLGEGTYVFNVWARDYSGSVTGPVTLAFSIRAAPWRTWWAYSFYGLVLAVFVFGVDRVQRRRLILKERQQSQLREAHYRAEAAEAQARAIEAENRRKSEELNFARQLQLSMLPKSNILMDAVDIVGQMRTATEVGGDYYDFVKIDDTRYCVAIGDATGHGVGAGLVVGMVKTALLNSVLQLKPDSTVRDLMVDLNTTLKASLTHRGVGMCFAMALVDTQRMTAEVCSTGMPFPCLYQNAGGQVRALEMPGPPLGFMKKIKPHAHSVQLAPQDRLIFLSDGFHERMNAAGDCWGYETVAREIGLACAAESSAGAIADRLIAACDQFADGRETDDDMTVIVISAKNRQGQEDANPILLSGAVD